MPVQYWGLYSIGLHPEHEHGYHSKSSTERSFLDIMLVLAYLLTNLRPPLLKSINDDAKLLLLLRRVLCRCCCWLTCTYSEWLARALIY